MRFDLHCTLIVIGLVYYMRVKFLFPSLPHALQGCDLMRVLRTIATSSAHIVLPVREDLDASRR